MSTLQATMAAAAADTRVRRKVLAMTVALAAITYLDRVAIGVARPYIARDLDLTQTQMGYVFSAFYLSYALFEIPTGWWGDKVGTRRVLTRIVCWWSAFTVMTGFAFSYSSLLAIRFLFGAGEAGAWPNVARTFSRWFPRRDRGTVQGTFFMGAHLAGGLTPLLATALLAYMSWRMLFVAVRIDRVHLGARVVSMVSRHARRASRRERRPSARSSKTESSPTNARSKRRSGRGCWPTGRSSASA